MNSVKIVGRVSQDVTVKYTANGKAVANFSVAVGRGNVKPGEQEPTDFINVVAWGKLGEDCGNELMKGQRVFVEGRWQGRSYENKEGQKVRVTEVVANFVAKQIMSGEAKKPSPAEQMGEYEESDIPF